VIFPDKKIAQLWLLPCRGIIMVESMAAKRFGEVSGFVGEVGGPPALAVIDQNVHSDLGAEVSPYDHQIRAIEQMAPCPMRLYEADLLLRLRRRQKHIP
jgi:hypothetical protein